MRACDNFSDGTDKRFLCRVVREQALPGGGGGGPGGGGGKRGRSDWSVFDSSTTEEP